MSQKDKSAKTKGAGDSSARSEGSAVGRLNLNDKQKKKYREMDHKSKAGFIKRWLVSGFSRKSISEETSIPYSTVRDITDELLRTGRLIRHGVKGCVPYYEDPTCPRSIMEADMNRLRGSNQSGDGSDVILPRLKKGKKCPLGYVDLHLASGLVCELRQIGDFEHIRDDNHFVVGEWDKHSVSKMTNQETHSGYVTVFGDQWRFSLYRWGTGTQCFKMYPVRALVKVDAFHCGDDLESMKAMVQAAIIDRANFVADHFLRDHGWQVHASLPESEEELRSFLKNVHAAREDDPLVKFIPPKKDLSKEEQGEVIVDESPGYPEIEIEGLEKLESFSELEIFSNFPKWINKINKSFKNAASKICCLEKSLKDKGESDTILLESLSEHAEVFETLSEVVSALETRQSSFFTKIVEEVRKIKSILKEIVGIQGESTSLIHANSRNIQSLSISRLVNPPINGRRRFC